MGWTKGRPRKLRIEATTAETEAPTRPVREPLKAIPKVDPRTQMRARPNWDDYVVEDVAENELNIPRDSFPDGMDMQWVADSCLGQSLAKERAAFERKGWTPVHQSDFEGLFNGRWMKKGEEGEINYKGLVLMARPLEYSVKAKQQEYRKAREQVSIKEAALRGGDLPVTLDSQHSTAIRSNVINRSYERIQVPSDD